MIRIRIADDFLVEREDETLAVLVQQFKRLSVEHPCSDNIDIRRSGVEDLTDVFHLFVRTVIQTDQLKDITACLEYITHVADQCASAGAVEITLHGTEYPGDPQGAFKSILFDRTRRHDPQLVTQRTDLLPFPQTDPPGGVRIQSTRNGGLTDTGKSGYIFGCDLFLHDLNDTRSG